MPADEIFISSSTRGLVPVTRCGDKVLPAGTLTETLRALWEREIRI